MEFDVLSTYCRERQFDDGKLVHRNKKQAQSKRRLFAEHCLGDAFGTQIRHYGILLGVYKLFLQKRPLLETVSN